MLEFIPLSPEEDDDSEVDPKEEPMDLMAEDPTILLALPQQIPPVELVAAYIPNEYDISGFTPKDTFTIFSGVICMVRQRIIR
ncbi:hypothetical protein RJT34_02188 [Clitoria ternatea]|uniref:Uncharacterized protein n=1 Tax=Clitoria ternatea TaxID=43366 RepID=A0AAN9KGY6_CLITE